VTKNISVTSSLRLSRVRIRRKDGRKSIRTEQVEEENRSRTGTSVSEGRGLTNKEHLFAASIAHQSSFQAMFENARNKEARVFFLSERVKQVDQEIALWMPHCNAMSKCRINLSRNACNDMLPTTMCPVKSTTGGVSVSC